MQATGASYDQRASLLDSAIKNQESSWSTGQRTPVEELLDRYPALRDDTEAVLDLIYHEMLLRRQRGESPRLEEYINRFPERTDSLVIQFAAEQAIRTSEGPNDSSRSTLTTEGGTIHAQGEDGQGPNVLVEGYQILGELGRGGMGVVYLARKAVLNRQCALKMVLASAHASREAIDRFLNEARSVAELDHPNVVSVYHVGQHDGLTYLELEYAEGGSLDKSLDGTPWQPRLGADLIEPLARAMEVAHRRGIVHRDLKPANILLDAEGTPKIADFGLAKLHKAGIGLTQTDSVLGSPSYMAPEQAKGRSRDAGPEADIYSLGAILYELLTGRPPFRGLSVLETLEQVKSTEPVRPSLLVAGMSRDIETITLKCLEKEPRKRYGSAMALADDLRRFLENRPIAARPVGRVERAVRWSRRNPWVAGFLAVFAIGATTAGVLAYVATQSARAAELAEAATRREWVRAEQETIRAKQSESDARAVLDFFQNKVLAAARPKEQAGGLGVEATIRQALDAAEPTIEKTFAGQPTVQASIRNALGESYYYLGEHALAISQLERARALWGNALGADHPDTLRSRNNLAGAYLAVGRVQEAIALHEKILEVKVATLGADHRDTLDTRTSLADAYREAGLLSKAIAIHEETLTLQASKLGPDHADTLDTRNNLAAALWSAGRLPEATAQFETTFKLMDAKLGPNHPTTLTSRNNLAVAYMTTGRTDEAIVLYKTTLKLLEDELGPGHPTTLTTRNNLAIAYQDAGRFHDATELHESTIKLMEAKQGLDHPRTLISRSNLARVYESTGRWTEAERLRRETLSRHRNADKPDRTLLAIELSGLGGLLLKESRWSEAEKSLRESVAIFEEVTPNDWRRYHAMSLLGEALLGQGQYDKAQPLIVSGYDGLQGLAAKIQHRDRPSVLAAAERVCRLYEEWGKPEQADTWKAKLGLRDLPVGVFESP
jgi:tetratricopeptide (TPR) repeat protein